MDKAVIPAVINGKITYFQSVNNSDLGFVFQYFGANVSSAWWMLKAIESGMC